MRALQFVTLAVAGSALVAGAALAAPTPRRRAPARPARKVVTRRPAPRVALKPPSKPRPVINLTARHAEARRAEVRVAAFIHAVQVGNWTRAASYLSRNVSAAQRQQLIKGPWLRPQRRNDFAHILRMPRIELRTTALKVPHARVRVLPLEWPKTRGQAFGVWDIPLVRENNRWTLNIHP